VTPIKQRQQKRLQTAKGYAGRVAFQGGQLRQINKTSQEKYIRDGSKMMRAVKDVRQSQD